MLEYFIDLEEEKAALLLQRSFYEYVLEFLRDEPNLQAYLSLHSVHLTTLWWRDWQASLSKLVLH